MYYTGDLIEFKYNGGTHPNQTRICLVLQDQGDKTTIQCWDFTIDELRNFCVNKMYEQRFLGDSEYKLLNKDNLPTSVQATIEKDFQDEGCLTYTTSGGLVYAIYPKPKSATITSEYSTTIVIPGKNRKNVRLYILNNSTIRLSRLGSGSIDEPTVDDLIEALKAVNVL